MPGFFDMPDELLVYIFLSTSLTYPQIRKIAFACKRFANIVFGHFLELSLLLDRKPLKHLAFRLLRSIRKKDRTPDRERYEKAALASIRRQVCAETPQSLWARMERNEPIGFYEALLEVALTTNDTKVMKAVAPVGELVDFSLMDAMGKFFLRATPSLFGMLPRQGNTKMEMIYKAGVHSLSERSRVQDIEKYVDRLEGIFRWAADEVNAEGKHPLPIDPVTGKLVYHCRESTLFNSVTFFAMHDLEEAVVAFARAFPDIVHDWGDKVAFLFEYAQKKVQARIVQQTLRRKTKLQCAPVLQKLRT